MRTSDRMERQHRREAFYAAMGEDLPEVERYRAMRYDYGEPDEQQWPDDARDQEAYDIEAQQMLGWMR